MQNPSLAIGRFKILPVHEALETLLGVDMTDAMREQYFGSSSLPSSLAFQHHLEALAQLIMAIEKRTNMAFGDTIYCIPGDSEAPVGVAPDGSIIISEGFLEIIEEQPEGVEAALLHELGHRHYGDALTMPQVLSVLDDFAQAQTVTALFAKEPKAFTAAVKGAYGSVDVFVQAMEEAKHSLESTMQHIPQLAQATPRSPVALLEDMMRDPSLLAPFAVSQHTPRSIMQKQQRIEQAGLQTPGYEAMQITWLTKRGVMYVEAQQYLEEMHELCFADDAQVPDIAGVTGEEIKKMRAVIHPLRPYAAYSDAFAAFAQTYVQATEHRADLYAAMHMENPHDYAELLEAIAGPSGDEEPRAANHGIRMHPNMAERTRVLKQALHALPAPHIQGETAEHHGRAHEDARLLHMLTAIDR